MIAFGFDRYSSPLYLPLTLPLSRFLYLSPCLSPSSTMPIVLAIGRTRLIVGSIEKKKTNQKPGGFTITSYRYAEGRGERLMDRLNGHKANKAAG